ncbi:MAG: NAD(P)-binding protein, partial [Caulobacteraceae bacterium]
MLAKDDLHDLTQNLWRKSPIDRPPFNEDVDVLVVGGGMSGIMTAGRLIQNCLTNIRLIERGGDFGGTWYW